MNLLPTTGQVFQLPLAADAHRSLAGFIDRAELGLAVEDLAAGGKSGPLMCLSRSLTSRSLCLERSKSARRTAPQMVRGEMFGGHPHCDAGGAVHQELRQGEPE